MAEAVDSPGGGGYALAMDERTERMLLERAREGEEEAFGDLVRDHAARLIRLAYRLVGDREEAEDIAQEAFLRLHRGLATFRGESRLGTWLYRTTTRLAIDHLRRERLKRQLFFVRRNEEEADPLESVADAGPSPAGRLLERERRRRLAGALEKLSPRQRAVFVLRHREELPLKEIAAILGLGEGTVKVHLHRAVKALQQELREEAP